MSEPSRLKRTRTVNIKVKLDLLKQAKNITMEEDLTDDLEHNEFETTKFETYKYLQTTKINEIKSFIENSHTGNRKR